MRIESWSQYQSAAARTAQYPHEQRWDYLSLGLVSEVGELAGKLKREIRDGAPRDVDALVLELGDCCWYTAQIASECGAHLDEHCSGPTVPPRRAWPLNAAVFKLASAVGIGCEEDCWDDVDHLVTIVNALRAVAGSLGVTIAEVCERNVAKLQSRAERGVIGGSGDAR